MDKIAVCELKWAAVACAVALALALVADTARGGSPQAPRAQAGSQAGVAATAPKSGPAARTRIASRAQRIFVPSSCDDEQYMPATIALDCPDGYVSIQDIVWHEWASEAQGQGTIWAYGYCNFDDPNCQGWGLYPYTVTVSLTQAQRCPASGVLQYRSLNAEFADGEDPLGVGGSLSTAMPCPDNGDGNACGPPVQGEHCGPGNGRRTPGGGGKVSHKGWPRVTGIFWYITDGLGHSKLGGPLNDELLGHHGSDRIEGAGGRDIIWGDSDPNNNNSHQRDVLLGGSGNDWIYPSHGPNKVDAGPGNDHVIAFYGRGTIDCGSGRDKLRVHRNGTYRVRNCEAIRPY